MARQNINIGTSANSGNGDQLRVAFTKINNNFTELYTALGLNENGLNLANFEFTNSTISTTDSSGITINQTLNLTSDLIVSGDIVPSADNLYDLGKPNKQFRSLYVSDSTIYIGGNALSIDNDGDLSFNNNKLAHENGEFIALDNLIDVNATDPDAGDTIAWSGSQYVNVPLIQDRLAHNGDEVVLVGGANPYVTFPAITGGDQLQISGAEVSALSGNLALSGQTTITLITNGAGGGGIGSQYFTLGVDGSLTIPGTIGSETEFKIEVNLTDSTKYTWRFGEDGELTFPDGTSQNTAATAGISATSTDTLTNKTINIQAGQGNVFQIQGNSITSYSGSGAVLALTSMPTFSGMNVNNSSLSIDGGSGSFYANTAFADGAGTIHKAGVYKSANNANNALFSFGANGAGTMSVVMDGSLFIGSALPANNGGLNTDYGGWLVVQAGAKFGGDLNTIGNFILDTPGNYVRFGDGTTQTTAADFGYLDLDKDTIKGTASYQYTFATDGYFTGSTNSESPNYFFVTYNATNANIAAGWTVVGGTANTTVSSVTYPVAGYPGVIRVNLTAAASSTSGFYPVTVTSPDRLRVEIQPNPGTSDKFAFTTSGLTFPDATVQTTAYTGTANLATVARNIESEGDVNIRVNLTDSTTRIWRFGEDGDLAFPDATVQTTAFTGNATTIDILNTNGIDTNYYITFVENRDGDEILRADVDLTFNSWSNTLTAGNVTTGVLKIDDGVHEKFQTKQDATGTVTHDCSLGHVFYHTSPDADWTANFTNLNLASGYATAVTLVIVQGGTGYYPSAVQIGGVGQTLNWQGNTTPTPSTNRTDVVTFSIINNSGTYTVLGQLTGF